MGAQQNRDAWEAQGVVERSHGSQLPVLTHLARWRLAARNRATFTGSANDPWIHELLSHRMNALAPGYIFCASLMTIMASL
jgi:hypothetical protein